MGRPPNRLTRPNRQPAGPRGLCVGKDPLWWDTEGGDRFGWGPGPDAIKWGDGGNRLARAICNVCPLKDTPNCHIDGGPRSVIINAIPYNAYNREIGLCRCGRPRARGQRCRICLLPPEHGLRLPRPKRQRRKPQTEAEATTRRQRRRPVLHSVTLAPCGTRSAANRHRRNGEPVDEACLQAERNHIPRGPRRPRQTRPLAPCGTYAAAIRHYKNSEPLDDACRQAKRDYENGRAA